MFLFLAHLLCTSIYFIAVQAPGFNIWFLCHQVAFAFLFVLYPYIKWDIQIKV